jgi:hypothetical protein
VSTLVSLTIILANRKQIFKTLHTMALTDSNGRQSIKNAKSAILMNK